MDEPQARVIFARLSDAEAPPARVDIGAARWNGRRKLRRRRAAASGPPAVAAAALALFAGGILPAPWHGQPQGSPSLAAPQPAAVAGFNPLVPYARFGWLPAGESLVVGTTARITQNIGAGPGQRARWSVTTMAAGRCNLSSGQIIRQLRRGAHPRLHCALGVNGSVSFQPKRQAPPVNGHTAFQDGPGLAWQYAPRSWAVLSEADHSPHLALMEKVAGGLTFGHLRQPALKFPYRLTGLPATWRAGSVHFVPDAGVLSGRFLYVAGTSGPDEPEVQAAPAGPDLRCPRSLLGQTQRRTINGVSVVVSHFPARDGSPATLQVCAAHDDGLFVLISTFGQSQPGAVSIFRHDLRALGRDPAHWTTSPLG